MRLLWPCCLQVLVPRQRAVVEALQLVNQCLDGLIAKCKKLVGVYLCTDSSIWAIVQSACFTCVGPGHPSAGYPISPALGRNSALQEVKQLCGDWEGLWASSLRQRLVRYCTSHAEVPMLLVLSMALVRTPYCSYRSYLVHTVHTWAIPYIPDSYLVHTWHAGGG